MKKLALALTLILCAILAALVACTGDPSDTAHTDAPAETWLCACGQDNGGKFCSECGTPRPEPDTTDAVTETVAECPLKAGAVDQIACGGIHFPANGARLDPFKCCFLCGKNGFVDALDVGIRLTNADCAGHIRAIATEARTEIHR